MIDSLIGECRELGEGVAGAFDSGETENDLKHKWELTRRRRDRRSQELEVGTLTV